MVFSPSFSKSVPGSAAPALSGPVSLPAGGVGSNTWALVCLHGFGADGNDLIGLAEPLRNLLATLASAAVPTAAPADPSGSVPELAVFSPHAPDDLPNSLVTGAGRQWFRDAGWTFRDRPGIDRARTLLWQYLETVVHRQHGIPPERTVVLGFSQGAMTSLYSVPRFPQPIAGLIGLAGILMWHEDLAPETGNKTYQKVPTLLLHGTGDDVVPADHTVAAAAALQALGLPVEYHLIDDVGHGINGPMLAHIGVFLHGLMSTPARQA